MKVRLGFVSNSSSSSFCIKKEAISVEQFDHLRNHIDYAILNKWEDWTHIDRGYSWDIKINDDVVECKTMMDNFDLHEFVIEVIGIPDDAIIDYYHS